MGGGLPVDSICLTNIGIVFKIESANELDDEDDDFEKDAEVDVTTDGDDLLVIEG